jgi:hypothetical protein
MALPVGQRRHLQLSLPSNRLAGIMRTEFSSVWPAMLTPLDDAGRVNHAQIERLVELFVEQRLGGVYVTC